MVPGLMTSLVHLEALAGHAVDDAVAARVHEPDAVRDGGHSDREHHHRPQDDVERHRVLVVVSGRQPADDRRRALQEADDSCEIIQVLYEQYTLSYMQGMTQGITITPFRKITPQF